MKHAFLFDMDGTIVDNMAYHHAAWLEFFCRRGQVIEKDEFLMRTAGRLSREIMRDYIHADLTAEECALLTKEKESIYQELYAPHRRTVTGFEALAGLAMQNGTALAVATAAPEMNIRFTLDGLGIRHYFDTVVGAADVAHGKPEPDVFLKAAERCGVPPERCIVFEDAPLGIEAARRAGMRAVALTTTMPANMFSDFGNVIAIAENFSGFTMESLLAR